MKDTLSFKIFKLLKTKKITQKELSEKTGIKQSSLSRILSDRYKTKTETLQKIAKALNVPVSSLLTDVCEEKSIAKDKENILSEKIKIKEEENKLLKEKIKFLEEKNKSLEKELKKKKSENRE